MKSVNIYDPEAQKLAIDVIERERRKCRQCGKLFTRFYTETPQPGDDRAGIVRVAAHCGTGGDNLHVFRVEAREILNESDEQALTHIIAEMELERKQ